MDSLTKKPPHTRNTRIDLPAEEFRRLGHQLVDQIAGLFDTMHDRRLTTTLSRDAINDLLPDDEAVNGAGQDAEQLLREATRLLFEHSLFNGHPGFMGYITSSPAPLGALGDLLAAAVNPNVGPWVLSPVATEIERQTIRWIARLMNYPAGGGLLVSGGAMANYVGFVAGLRAIAGERIRTHGLRGLPKPLAVYCSRETHTWVQKAADLHGLGTDSIRWIETDAEQRMRPDALAAAIRADLEAGWQPALVVATVGSVSTGVVDPLVELGAICARYALWFHADGAYGGVGAGLPELSELFAGIDQLDSIALDPHKWLYAPLEAGCTLVKDPKYLTDAFSYQPPYYNFEQAGMNFVDYGPQNSRGFRALKVWLTLQHLGLEGHRQLIREDIQLAAYAYELFDADPAFEAGSCHLSIATFRYLPPAFRNRKLSEAEEQELNALNEALLNKIERSGRFFVSKAIVNGKFLLRLCIVNFRTSRRDMEEMPGYIAALAEG